MAAAGYDEVTGLPDRTVLSERIAEAMAFSGGEPQSVAVLLLDLDRFWPVADVMGPDAGDGLLAAVADRIRTCAGPADTPARMRGDEFALLIAPCAGEEPARAMAERLIAALDVPFRIGPHELRIGASIGIALNRGPGTSLLGDADVALYRAKRRGHGTFAVYERRDRTARLGQIELESEIKHAVARGELRLLYQPIVRIASGEIIGVEALLRWNHPDRGLLRPGEFLAAAEQAEQLVPIGRWVIGEASRRLRRWEDATGRTLDLAVNLSAPELNSPELPADIERALIRHGISAERLVLEVTEAALVQDAESGAGHAAELRKRGVRIAIDRYGTGYLSLHTLRDLPVDALKIAKGFIDRLGRGERDVDFARSILALGASLRLTVCADGIEDPRQLALLGQIGCEFGEGFLLGRPVDGEATAELLARHGGRVPTSTVRLAPWAAVEA